jgi:hypothetical protein
MKVYTIDQFKNIQDQQNYKYLGLFNAQGNVIIPISTNKTTTAQRLREIETRLMSEALPDGYYFIKCKNSVVKTTPTDDYAILKGNKLSEDQPQIQPVQVIEKPVFQPEVLTYDSALKLQVQLERLKLENQHLKQEIESLKSEIEENKLLSEEEQPSIMDNAKSWLQEILSIGAPLLDKHFQLKEQQLQLKAYELKQLGGIRPQRPMQNPENDIRPENNKRSYEEIIMTFQDQPETYNKLADFYNNAQNEEEFLQNIKLFDLGIFNLFAK